MLPHESPLDSTREERLGELLLSWEEQWERGSDVSAERLCSKEPHLRAELERRIAALKDFGRATRGHRSAANSPPESATAVSHFEQLRLLARGGLGEVYEAFDRSCSRAVALKFIRCEYAGDQASQRLFLAEAEVTGRLAHPGVVPVYGQGSDAGGNPFYAMQLVRGVSLADAIAEFHSQAEKGPPADRHSRERLARLLSRIGGGQPASSDSDLRDQVRRELLRRFIAVCQTVEYAHSRQVIHRDLKPGNIMLGEYGETLVLDWGLAKARGTERETGVATGSGELAGEERSATASFGLKGTPAFMAPEQARGSSEAASDVYGLGATLYALLTGSPPFGGPLSVLLEAKQRGDFPPPRARNASVPRALEAICLKAMALEVAERYATPRELAGDIENWLADRPVDAFPEPWPQRLARWARRHRTWVRAATAALIVVASVAVAAALLVNAARQNEAAQRSLAQDRLVLANEARREESAQRAQAEQHRQLAEERLDEVQTTAALRHIDDGDPALAMLASAETLRSRTLAPDVAAVRRRRIAALWRELPKLAQLWPFPRGVVAGQFSPDGTSVFLASEDGTAEVRDIATGLLVGAPMRHGGMITAAALSPDGRFAVTCGRNATARIWNIATGEAVCGPLSHRATVRHAEFSRDGLLVVTASYDHTARVWSAQTGEPLLTPLEHEHFVNWAEFSPDGKRVVTACDDKTAVVWSLRDGRAERQWVLPMGGPVHQARFSPDGQMILTTGGGAAVWSAATGRRLSSPADHVELVLHSQFSAGGDLYVTADTLNRGRIWSAETGASTGTEIVLSDWARFVELSPDGRLLAVAGNDWTVRVADARRPGRFSLMLRHGGPVRGARFSIDGRRLLTFGDDRCARLWDLAGIEAPSIFWQFDTGGAGEIDFKAGRAVTVTPGSGRWRDEGEVRLWLPRSGGFDPISIRHRKPVLWSGFSPGGRHIAIVGIEGTVRLCSAVDGRDVSPTIEHRHPVKLAQFNRGDGRFLLTVTGYEPTAASFGGVAMAAARPEFKASRTSPGRCALGVWDTATGSVVGPLLEQDREIAAAAISPDGTTAVYAIKDAQVREVRVRDVRSGNERVVPVAGSVDHISFSPDGYRFVAVSGDQAQLFSTDDWQSVEGTLRHAEEINVVQFSPDSTRLLTGSQDRTARLWDAQTGKAMGIPMRHPSRVISGEFSPDFRLVVTLTTAGQLRVWDAASGEPVTSRQETAIRAMRPGDASLGFDSESNVVGMLLPPVLGKWNLSPLPDATDTDLFALAKLASALSTPETSPTTGLPAEDLSEILSDLRERHDDWFRVSDEQVAAWHAIQGEDARQRGDWRACLIHSSEMIRRHEPYWWELLLHGLALGNTGRPAEAIPVVTRALEQGGERETYLYLVRATSYARLGEWESARRDCTKVIDGFPEFAMAWAYRAQAAANLKDYAGAASDFVRALELDATLAAPYWYEGCLLCLITGNEQKYTDLSAKMWARFRDAADSQDRQAALWTCLLHAVADDGSPPAKELLAAAEALAAKGPQNVRLSRTLALALYRAGDIPRAVEVLEQALERIGEEEPPSDASPERQGHWRIDRPYCLFILALAHDRAGEADKAQAVLDKARTIAATPPPYWGAEVTFQLLEREAQQAVGKGTP